MASITSGSFPSLIATPWLLPLAVIAVAISYTIYQRFFHPFASIPGPFWGSLTRLWMTKHSWDGDMNTVMMALHAKHGPLVRVAPWEISVADPNAIKKIYGAGTKFRKSDWVCMLWRPFAPNLQAGWSNVSQYSVWQGHRKFDLFAERNERIHGEQRRLVSRAYSMEALRDLEPYVDNAVKVFMDNMKERKDQVIDMGNWVQLFAFGQYV